MDVTLSDNHRLHVRGFGNGDPTLLLIHGWSVSGRIWDPLVSAWPASAGKLVIPELRGAGKSSRPAEGYSLDDYTSDVVGLIDALSLKQCVMVGHSMGGTIAMRVALKRPQSLAKLVLISPVPAGGAPLGPEDPAHFRAAAGRRDGPQQLLESFMNRKPSGQLLHGLVDDAAGVSIDAFWGGFDAWRTAAFAESISKITTPTVVLGGEAEQLAPPEFLRAEVVAQIPGATFIPMSGVGHYPQIECPVLLASLLHEICQKKR